jgi:OMF family outer membrane factor
LKSYCSGRNFLLSILISILILSCAAPLNAQPDNSTVPAGPELKGPILPNEKNSLPELTKEATSSSGAIFLDADKVVVEPPMLKALITLDRNLNPLQLDATSQVPVSLKSVLDSTLANNLPLRISRSESETNRWNYLGSIGGFLPNIVNTTSFQGIHGNIASPGGIAVALDSPYLNMANGFTYNLYKGGAILGTMRQNRHLYKASQAALKGTMNDVMYQAANLFYQLALNDVLLQIRVKAVDVSKGLLLVQEDQFANGVNTKLDVLQARTQLSRDRQNLIAQQVARRQAAVNLATALNLDPAVDFVIAERIVAKKRLVDESVTAAQLVTVAIENRPELKKYEEERLAALQAIKVARAAFLPTIQAVGTTVTTAASIIRRDSSSTSSSNSAAITSSGTVVSGVAGGGGGLPLGGASGGSSSGGRYGLGKQLWVIGVEASWTLSGLGLTTAASVQAAKTVARRAQLEFNDQLAKVYQDVRNTFLDSLSAESLIAETTDAVNSSQEQLDITKMRLEEGIGTNLDVLNAQKDYTSALIDKANAILKFNIAQASLLRAIGKVDTATLLSSKPYK